MVKFTAKESSFIKKMPEARVATISSKGWPQVTTVIHVFDGRHIYFAIDYNTVKYKNLLKNKKVALAIDVYKRQPSAVIIQGIAKMFDEGKEFDYALKLLQKRHQYYRANPFKPKEAPIVRVEIKRKSSWGL
ncbi:MAG: pyridoxamine 5'-phosphate oxidase family protein [Candidatus Micrarchaeota archaeon]|nr:pyridoxamine 5'-phosphate oxidase family protein [Candidatus Micrarchaeota archaeon]